MKTIVGIDEVGRGPLAGPVTFCVVACDKKIYTKLKKDKRLPPLGKDSKKLSPVDREKYAKILKSLISNMSKRHFDIHKGRTFVEIKYVIVHISNTIIDTRGLSFAIKFAISSGIKKLKLNSETTHILLDGGLKAPKEFIHQKTIIKGDEKEQIIAWASILAKVSRDALMRTASKKFPHYGFETHKGYGTLRHRTAIGTHGLSAFHRRSFCKNILL